MASQGIAAAPGPSAEVALEQLGAALARLAPKAMPSAAPAPPKAVAVLSQLYEVTEEQLLLQSGQGSCEVCSDALAQPIWSIDWDIDVTKQRMSPKRCLRVCKFCAAVRDLPRLIER